MTGKNRDHVAVYSDRRYEWTFVVPSVAEEAAEHGTEIVALCKSVLANCENFLTPTRITTYVRRYDRGTEYPFESDGAAPHETTESVVEDADGVRAERYETSLDLPRGYPFRIPRIYFDHTRVRVCLEDGLHDADRTQNCFLYSDEERLDQEPTVDPVSVSIAHAQNMDHSEITADFVYYVEVALNSDLWFEDTGIGQDNREQLRRFLDRLDSEISSVELVRNPRRGMEPELSDIL